jgi:hypothetical protein
MASPAENVAKLKDAYRQWHETKGGSVKLWLDLMADHVRVRSLAAGARGHLHERGQLQGRLRAVLQGPARRVGDDRLQDDGLHR